MIPAPSIQTIHTLTNRFMEMTPTIAPTAKRKITVSITALNTEMKMIVSIEFPQKKQLCRNVKQKDLWVMI